jgi:inosine-uridine nucleoside N-ribohydrolase
VGTPPEPGGKHGYRTQKHDDRGGGRPVGAEATVAEAMRTDTSLPLVVAVSAGLSEVASALPRELAVAERMTLVWIGGGTYREGGSEDKLDIDPGAAQVVFNDSAVPLWQVTRDVDSQCGRFQVQ